MGKHKARMETASEAKVRRSDEIRKFTNAEIPTSSSQVSYGFIKKSFIDAVTAARNNNQNPEG